MGKNTALALILSFPLTPPNRMMQCQSSVKFHIVSKTGHAGLPMVNTSFSQHSDTGPSKHMTPKCAIPNFPLCDCRLSMLPPNWSCSCQSQEQQPTCLWRTKGEAFLTCIIKKHSVSHVCQQLSWVLAAIGGAHCVVVSFSCQDAVCLNNPCKDDALPPSFSDVLLLMSEGMTMLLRSKSRASSACLSQQSPFVPVPKWSLRTTHCVTDRSRSMLSIVKNPLWQPIIFGIGPKCSLDTEPTRLVSLWSHQPSHLLCELSRTLSCNT